MIVKNEVGRVTNRRFVAISPTLGFFSSLVMDTHFQDKRRYNKTIDGVECQFATRAAYVSVPKGHPWYGHTADDLRHVPMHGGCTYAGPRFPSQQGSRDAGWWVGWDYMHYADCVGIDGVWDAEAHNTPIAEAVVERDAASVICGMRSAAAAAV